jgi:nucleotide-binding universal stress UspA family protein
MIGRIFLPLNLSSNYLHVLDHGLALAQKSGAPIDFLYATGAWLKKSSATFHSLQEMDAAGFLSHLTDKDQKEILHVVAKANEANVNFSFTYKEGVALKAIIEQVNSQEYELMVLGTRDKAHTSIIKGPFVNKVLAQTSLPILIVPETLPYNTLSHITFATDLQDFDEPIIRSIIALAQSFDAQLTLLNIAPPRKEGENMSEQYLHVLNRTIDLTLVYPNIRYQFMEKNDIYDGIEEFVELSSTQLIAMINRTPIKALNTRHSITGKVMKRLNVPILAFRKITVTK